MILLFGGTTEGLAASRLLDDLGLPYLYLTKTATTQKVKGEHLSGALDAAQISELCQERDVNLMIDAGHPFAQNLHDHVTQASLQTGIEAIRFERPQLEDGGDGVRWFDSFAQMKEALLQFDACPVLALTGVQTIRHFEGCWQMPIHFRILDTELSMQKALETGIALEQIHPAPAHITDLSVQQLIDKTGARLILTKESGTSGYLEVKMRVAQRNQLPLWVVKRPPLPDYAHTKESVKALHQLLLVMKRDRWKEDGHLRSGLTTGTCATAAARASLMAIATGVFPDEVTVHLPDGTDVSMRIYPSFVNDHSAACTVVKDAGDDPDVTHAAEIGCEVRLSSGKGITFERGKGVGVVTLAGLQCGIGEPAINATPRRMIEETLLQTARELDVDAGMTVIPFVPEGEQLALRTFNPRVGVEGGISIIGTSGRVKPLSHEGFVASIAQQIHVAKAMGCETMVATSGRRSELMMQPHFSHLPEQAFVHHGNFIGEVLHLAEKAEMKTLVVGIMIGKAVKLAEGHLNTHSHQVAFNASFIADMALTTGYSVEVASIISNLTLANAIVDIIPFQSEEPFYLEMARRCRKTLWDAAGSDIAIEVAVIKDEMMVWCRE